ncbi:hypothetical protein ACFQAS_09645 [Halopenitus salinus]|uniref:CARDB domain-containing protein n=1 Tax=Halopenitus salinus TaxID=1198295 RepID=A0ABD5UWK8_9EURY
MLEADHLDQRVPVDASTTTRTTVRNEGYTAATRTLSVTASRSESEGENGEGGDRRVANRTVILDPGEERTLESNWTAEPAGTYDVRVGSIHAGELRVVEETATPEPTAEPSGTAEPGSTSATISWMWLLFVVVLLTALAAISRRREDDRRRGPRR